MGELASFADFSFARRGISELLKMPSALIFLIFAILAVSSSPLGVRLIYHCFNSITCRILQDKNKIRNRRDLPMMAVGAERPCIPRGHGGRQARDLPMMRPAAEEDEDCEDETDEDKKDDIWPPGLREKCKNRTPDRYSIAYTSAQAGHRSRGRRDLPMMAVGANRESAEDGEEIDLNVACQFYEFLSKQPSGRAQG